MYLEDKNVICVSHSFEVEGKPQHLIMFFARLEDGKYKFLQTNGGARSIRA